MTRWLLLRDIFIFFGGLLGMLHETVLSSGGERSQLILAFLAMMGLPAFLGNKKDEKTTKDSPND